MSAPKGPEGRLMFLGFSTPTEPDWMFIPVGDPRWKWAIHADAEPPLRQMLCWEAG